MSLILNGAIDTKQYATIEVLFYRKLSRSIQSYHPVYSYMLMPFKSYNVIVKYNCMVSI